MAALGVLLRSAGRVCAWAAVSVLLDGGDQLPAGCRALPAVDGAQLHAVLDAAADARPHRVSTRRDAIQPLDAQYPDDLDRGHGDLAVLRAARGLRALAAQVPVCWQPRHGNFCDLPGAADAALHSAR